MKTTSPPCPTCPKYNAREAIHTAPGRLKLPNDHSRAGEWVSYDFFCLLDISVFSHSLCFHTGLESSLADRLLPLLLLKPFQKRLSLPGASSQTRGLLSDYTVVEEPLFLDRCLDKSVLCSWFCTQPQSSGLIDSANGITKTKLAKFATGPSKSQIPSFWNS